MKSSPRSPARRIAATLLLSFGLAAGAMAESVDPRDPWEEWNRDVQSVNDRLDEYVMEPVASGYRWITPQVVDRGITNFFSNVDDIGVFLNDFLQFKPLQGGQDLGRFMINTTAGIGGFIDVASYLDLFKHKEDFDQTLAVWGVPSGPYLVLPFFGPGTMRGVVGLVGDTATNPHQLRRPHVHPHGDRRHQRRRPARRPAKHDQNHRRRRPRPLRVHPQRLSAGSNRQDPRRNPPEDEEQAQQERDIDAEMRKAAPLAPKNPH